jgi:hypothetical protein
LLQNRGGVGTSTAALAKVKGKCKDDQGNNPIRR